MNQSDMGITIESVSEKTARGVGQLFRAVYGEEYPVKLYYDPSDLMATIARGDLVESVALNAEGKVVGVGNMYRSAPFKGIYECGAGLVLPEYRKMDIFGRLYRYLYEVSAPELGIPFVFGEDVCNHVYTQMMQAQNGFVPMALEVALMPAETYGKEKSAQGRVASLLDCRTYRKTPHRVYLPAPYLEALEFIYQGLDDERFMDESTAGPPPEAETRLQVNRFSEAKMARIMVSEIGSDLASRLADEEAEDLEAGCVALYISLPLACPWVGAAVDILRECGFFLAGVLPRWFDKDAVLMQKLFTDPNWEGINLHLERAERIREIVKSDWLGVAG